MPRDLRYFAPGVVYHLISRFVEQRFLVTTNLQRDIYVDLHRKALKRTDWQLLGFAIMSNHIHLAALAGAMSLDTWLRPVHSPFADMLNKDHNRIGPVFVRGPNAFAVPYERVPFLLAYIHNNPVRANVCGAAVDSTWTSHRAYVGAAAAPRCLSMALGFELIGMTPTKFNEFVDDPTQREDRSFSEEAHERELMENTNPLCAIPGGQLASAIMEATTIVFGVSAEHIRGNSRGPAEVAARAAAAQSTEVLGLAAQPIADALNISVQRVCALRRKGLGKDALEIANQVAAKFKLRVRPST